MATTQKKVGAGELTEQVTILTATPVSVSVTSITRSNQTATVTTASAHGFTTGDYVTHAGATQTEYNVEAQITVTGATTYAFAVSGSPASPATGTITTIYTSDSRGGATTAPAFYTLTSGVWANVRALSADERLALGGISAIGSYMVRLYYRSDLLAKMRLSWTPFGFASAKTLEIHGIQPDPDDPRRFMLLNVGEVAA